MLGSFSQGPAAACWESCGLLCHSGLLCEQGQAEAGASAAGSKVKTKNKSRMFWKNHVLVLYERIWCIVRREFDLQDQKLCGIVQSWLLRKTWKRYFSLQVTYNHNIYLIS